MTLLNFESQLVFYGQYHHNLQNKVIHIVCVPIIVWSMLVWLCRLPTVLLFDVLKFNVPFGLTFCYIIYYVLLDPIAGAAISPLLLGMAYSAYVFTLSTPHSWLVAAVLQVACWTLQIIGHHCFERRSPAFFDNLVQAFLLAPLFVFVEVLFVLGYRPALRKRINDKVKAAIQTWRHSSSSKRSQ